MLFMPERLNVIKSYIKKYFLPVYHVLWAVYLISAGVACHILSSKGYEIRGWNALWHTRGPLGALLFVCISFPVVMTPFFSRNKWFLPSYVFLFVYGFMFGAGNYGMVFMIFIFAVAMIGTKRFWAAALTLLVVFGISRMNSILSHFLAEPIKGVLVSEAVDTSPGGYSVVLEEYYSDGKTKQYCTVKKTADLGILVMDKAGDLKLDRKIKPSEILWRDGTTFSINGTLYDAGEILDRSSD